MTQGHRFCFAAARSLSKLPLQHKLHKTLIYWDTKQLWSYSVLHYWHPFISYQPPSLFTRLFLFLPPLSVLNHLAVFMNNWVLIQQANGGGRQNSRQATQGKRLYVGSEKAYSPDLKLPALPASLSFSKKKKTKRHIYIQGIQMRNCYEDIVQNTIYFQLPLSSYMSVVRKSG